MVQMKVGASQTRVRLKGMGARAQQRGVGNSKPYGNVELAAVAPTK